jgi:phosphatidylinositol-3-phosphatase
MTPPKPVVARKLYLRLLAITIALLLLSICVACGSAVGIGNTLNNGTGSSGPVPQFSHVIVVMEENASFSDVIGSSSMPYLNGLANKYSLATKYYGNTHPSIGNYFMLTTGKIETNDDGFSGTITDDNLARQFAKDAKTWKAYAESIPSAGYLGGDSGPYLKHHMPFAYFSDVTGDSTQAANIVPFSNFSSDLTAGILPAFSLIVPNARHDGHDCPGGGVLCQQADRLATADTWLQSNIAPLLNSSSFSDTLLVIVFDEGDMLDMTNSGGHVAAVLISPKVKMAYQGSGQYQHENLERLIGDALKLSSLPGAGNSSGTMGEFFTQP